MNGFWYGVSAGIWAMIVGMRIAAWWVDRRCRQVWLQRAIHLGLEHLHGEAIESLMNRCRDKEANDALDLAIAQRTSAPEMPSRLALELALTNRAPRGQA